MHTMSTSQESAPSERIVRVNISLPVEVDEMLARRSKEERRSKSAHVAWLVERDAAAQAP